MLMYLYLDIRQTKSDWKSSVLLDIFLFYHCYLKQYPRQLLRQDVMIHGC